MLISIPLKKHLHQAAAVVLPALAIVVILAVPMDRTSRPVALQPVAEPPPTQAVDGERRPAPKRPDAIGTGSSTAPSSDPHPKNDANQRRLLPLLILKSIDRPFFLPSGN